MLRLGATEANKPRRRVVKTFTIKKPRIIEFVNNSLIGYVISRSPDLLPEISHFMDFFSSLAFGKNGAILVYSRLDNGVSKPYGEQNGH